MADTAARGAFRRPVLSTAKRPGPRGRRDLMDRIEDFIETRVEKNLKKGLDELERFIRHELLKKKDRGGREDDKSLFSYLETFLKDKKVAAVMPSSKFIVQRVLRRIDWRAARVIIEYGPARGVITKELLSHLRPDGTLVAIETNQGFVAALGELKDPRLKVFHGSVLDVDRLLEPLGVGPAQAIVSGIPFSLLKPIQRHQLLHKTDDRLAVDGRFIAYQITTHLVPLMKYHFRKVDVQYEIRNLPPHFVFTGYK